MMTTLLQGIKQWAQYASEARAKDTIDYADAVERLGKLARYYRLIGGQNRKRIDALVSSLDYQELDGRRWPNGAI